MTVPGGFSEIQWFPEIALRAKSMEHIILTAPFKEVIIWNVTAK